MPKTTYTGDTEHPAPAYAFLSWSMPLWRTSSLEVRASWMLLVWILFDSVPYIRGHLWFMLPATVLVPFLSIGVHALAHVWAARLVGGSAPVTVLSVLNDYTVMYLPLRPSAHFLAGAAGPLVSAVIWLLAMLLAAHSSSPTWTHIAKYIEWTNLSIAIFNLLACSLFDGARIWRGLLWSMVRLERAVRWTAILAFLSCAFILTVAVWGTNWLWLMLGISCLLVTIQEQRSINMGYDPVIGADMSQGPSRARGGGFFARWLERRREAAAEARARADEVEQELLDRLLAKVSEHGLSALTQRERSMLHAISRRQRKRQDQDSA